MPNTTCRHYSGVPCSDCGVTNVDYCHNRGVLVPTNTGGFFCQACMDVRVERNNRRLPPLPIGETSYIKRLKGRVVLIRYPFSKFGVGDKTPTDKICGMQADLGIANIIWSNVGSTSECTFRWLDSLDQAKVDKWLNDLRAQFPCFCITRDWSRD